MRTKTAKKVKMDNMINLDNNIDPSNFLLSVLDAVEKINKNSGAYCKELKDAINKVKTNKLNEITKLSFEAPRKLNEEQYSLLSDKIKDKDKGGKGRKAKYWMFKGVIYKLNELCVMFKIPYGTIVQRYRMEWNEYRIWGVESHRIDHYISENLEMMITKID